MSVESMAIVLHHSPSSGTDKVILLGIANHDGDGGSWPSIATLAKYANIDRRGVQKAIARLEKSGQITRILQRGGTLAMRNGQRPNMYVLNVRCPDNCDRTTVHRLRDVPQDTPVPQDAGRGVPQDAGRGVPQDALTVHLPSTQPSVVRVASSSVVSPPVTRERTSRTTPTQMLDGVGLARRDHGRFKAWMRTTKNARSADAVIATSDRDDLVAQVREWRATLTFRTDRDAEPLLCRHGNDVALGDHMCPACDPDRPDITTVSGEVPWRPAWVQEQIDAGNIPPMPEEAHA